MKIERLESLPKHEVREFYFTYLKLPYPEGEQNEHPAHHPDGAIESVTELYDSPDDRPSGIVIFFDELWFEVVDTTTGERIRLTIGEMNAEDAKDQRFDALVHLALVDSQALAKSVAEITTYLEQKECVGALQTFRSLDGRLKFLGTILETAAGRRAAASSAVPKNVKCSPRPRYVPKAARYSFFSRWPTISAKCAESILPSMSAACTRASVHSCGSRLCSMTALRFIPRVVEDHDGQGACRLHGAPGTLLA